MAKKGILFYLIKSLTKAEKRHFNIFCFNNKVSKNYLSLFEIIAKQSEYDEGAIRKKFKGQLFIKQLHVAKNYLNQLILKSLRNYHSKISKEAEIRDLLRNIEILFSKELFDQCHFELQKAEKLAKIFEDYTSFIAIQKWKKRLSLSTGKNDQSHIQEILDQEKKAIEALDRINQYWMLTNQIFEYSNDLENKFSKHPLIKSPQVNDSMAAKILHQHILYSYHIINRNAKEGFRHLNDLVQYLEQFPQRISNDPSSYLTALNNKIGFLIRMKKFDEASHLLEKVRNIPQKYKLKSESKFSVKLQLRTYNIELEMYRDTRNFSKGTQLITKIELFLKKYKKSISREYQLLLWYQFANIYFMKRDYNASMKYVNEIIGTRFGDSTHELERYTRLLNLMIHLDLDNIFVLKYAVEGCRRFLRRVRRIHKFEKVLLRFFSKICNTPKSEYAGLFLQLNRELFEGTEIIIDEDVLDYLNFKIWIEEKLAFLS